MAFFGAPIHYPDHGKMSCLCALDMMEKLKLLNTKFREDGLPAIDIGIGMNTGEMSVGNMGSETVRSYTVMGDAVNLGARLEGINKQYGTHIIISEFTHKDIDQDFLTREIDWVRVKGKLEPVRIFELIACKESGIEQPDGKEKVIQLFKDGFNYYHEKQWSQAMNCFEGALKIDPNDGPTKLYVNRTSGFQENPPEDNWDGVFLMKTK